MGKISFAIVILVNTFFICVGTYFLFFHKLNILNYGKNEILIWLSLRTLFSISVIILYESINRLLSGFYKPFKVFTYLFIVFSIYFFFFFSAGYNSAFLWPFIFVICQGISIFDKRIKFVFLSNLLTLVLCVLIALIDTHEFREFTNLTSYEIFYILNLTYFGVFHCFLVLFNGRELLKKHGD